MKIAHFYPGLRYKSSIMRKEIFSDQRVQEKLAQASRVLNKNVPAICQVNRSFESTEECFVTTLAACVGVGSYHMQRFGDPDVIVGSSFGHYAALVMAGALDYQATLELVKRNGQVIDQYFSNHSTFLVSGIPLKSLKRICAGLPGEAVHTAYSDGFAITAPWDALDDLFRRVEEEGGESEQIPLRLKYHSPFMREAEILTHPHFAALRIRSPKNPFLSAFCADFVSAPERILYVLKHRTSRPNYLEESVSVLIKLEISHIVHMQASRHISPPPQQS